MTVLDLIKSSMRLIGVLAAGETPRAEESQDALKTLNMMLGQWNNEKLLSYQTLSEEFTLTVNKSTYSIGVDGEFNTIRPMKLFTSLITEDDLDNPLDVISKSEYLLITDKSTTGRPTKIMYDPSYPFGSIKLYPVPDSAYKITLSKQYQFSNVTLNTEINLPDGYEEALRCNLAVKLAPEYGAEPKQIVYNDAVETKANIKRTNTVIPKVKIDPILVGRSSYNVYTDE